MSQTTSKLNHRTTKHYLSGKKVTNTRRKKDPTIRNLLMLRLIPRQPASISTVQLRDALLQEDPDFDICLRSLQRDLGALIKSRYNFNLQCSRYDPDETISKQRPYRWSYAAHARPGLPLMTSAEALAMCLSEGHLHHLLPPNVLTSLEPHFAEARAVLGHNRSKSHERWAQRVRSLPNGKALLPACVDKTIWENVAEALLTQKQLKVEYLSKKKGQVTSMILHPKGMVSRGPSTYLIASAGKHIRPYHFALHRFKEAIPLDTASRDDNFDMDSHLPDAAFTPREETGDTEIVADIDPELAWILRETPICVNQRIESLPESSWMRLSARLPSDHELTRWLLSISGSIKIHSPCHLRKKIIYSLQQALNLHEIEARPS